MKSRYSNDDDPDDLILEAIEMQRSDKDNDDDPFDVNPRNDKGERGSDSDTSDGTTSLKTTQKGGGDAPPPSSARRCLLGGFLLVLLSGIILAVLFATGLVSNDDLNGIPILGNVDFEGFFDTDPFDGLVSPQNPEDAFRWYTPKQAGLELTVLNALSDDWQGEFVQAMDDWEVGEPDILTLQTRRIDYEVECEPLNGLLKVCNADYGATEWRGLNAVLLDMGRRYIYSSTAKMNEYYLRRASAAQRQYTMCHELGHGFGLPHWDEDFFNRNMGNCMDYTSRPRTNQQPDRSNFEFLEQLYGRVGATQAPGATDAPQQGGVGWGGNSQSQPPPENNEKEEGDEDRRRQVQQQQQQEIPDEVMAAYRAVLNGEDIPHPSRVLQSNHDGEATVTEVGDYVLMVYKLGPL